MCGILGFCGNFEKNDLELGLSRIRHRGPDDSGLFLDARAGIGLGHVRLSILDLSPLGHQPMVSGDGHLALTYNGEIYNFRELKAELEEKSFVFRGSSDTEVLLNLYLAEGEDMLRRLNGIFAFALWDGRKQQLFIARDGLGVKPLYYTATSQGIAFCSEIKGLLPLVPEAREVDAPALHRYLNFLWCPGEGTALKAVRKLLPGEAMLVRAGRIERRWTWYRLPVFRTAPNDLPLASVVDGTAAHVRQAVQRQMVADVPVGAFLSGGLDSSAVVAFAREQNPDIRCFTIEMTGGQEEGMADDLPYAKAVAKHLGVALEIVRIDADRMAGDLERMVAQMDEPLADPAPINVLYISQLAKEHGMKVLLSGAGGDDLFTGYRRHFALHCERAWDWLPAKWRRGFEAATARLDQRNPIARRLSKMFSGAGLDGNARIAAYFAWAREADLWSLYSEDFQQAIGTTSAALPMLDFLGELPKQIAPLDRMLALEQRFFLADHNLIYTDKMSMAAGVEVRVPFLDIDLVDYAARIPLRYKQRGREGKWVLKKAMEPYLPKEVIYRPKTGFGAPLRRWLRYELKDMIADLLSERSLRNRGVFDPNAVKKLLQNDQSGRIDGTYTIFALMCIELWCRHYIDQPFPSGSSQ